MYVCSPLKGPALLMRIWYISIVFSAVTVNNKDNDNDKNITGPIFISSGSFIWLCLLPLGEGESVTFPPLVTTSNLTNNISNITSPPHSLTPYFTRITDFLYFIFINSVNMYIFFIWLVDVLCCSCKLYLYIICNLFLHY